jgi:hypothetical protein
MSWNMMIKCYRCSVHMTYGERDGTNSTARHGTARTGKEKEHEKNMDDDDGEGAGRRNRSAASHTDVHPHLTSYLTPNTSPHLLHVTCSHVCMHACADECLAGFFFFLHEHFLPGRPVGPWTGGPGYVCVCVRACVRACVCMMQMGMDGWMDGWMG